MRALFIDTPGSTEIRDIPKPSPGPDEALLRIHYIGFCGSDLSSYRGKSPMVSYPRIPGHEIAATVEDAGRAVPPSLAPGSQVTVVPYTACGVCPSCRRGRANACRVNQTLGVQRDGAMTEYITVPWRKILHPPGILFRDLSLVEPLSVGFHAVDRGRVTSSDTVAVLGCGAVGLGAISASAYRGARTIVVDLDDAKLDLAMRAGGTDRINSAKEDLHTRLVELTGGNGPDVIIEAIGIPATFRAAVEEVAFTGRVVYIGYAKDQVCYESKLFVQKELDILGSRNATAEDFEAVIQMLREGKFPADDAITAIVSLDEAGEALRSWDRNPAAVTKLLVNLSG